MRIIETDDWCCDLPDEWQAEQSDDSVLIVDDDEVSSIEITTLKKEAGDISDDDLKQFADEPLSAGIPAESVAIGSLQGMLFNFEDEEGVWREWYLASGSVMLYITHGCRPEHRGMDDAAVNEILSTIELKNQSPA